ncbi:MAG: hypothetical protein IJB14_06870 [Firmicutes bacterium]|nr:hypothetical protein [Bacillota bacterium]
MISNKEIDLEISFYEDLRRKYKKRISHYPEGNINFKFEHNCYRAYIGINHKQKYLGAKDWTLTSRLVKKKIDTLSLKYIEENLKLLKLIQAKYKGIEYIFGDGVIKDIETKIGRGFKVDDFLLSKSTAKSEKTNLGKIESNEAISSNCQTAIFRQENKIHKTPADVKVRSRAELVIATFLEMKGIDYIYEKPLKLFLKTVAPDFTIKRKSDGKIIIWEHFGMMDDPEYYESRMEVLNDYHHAGWLPYENFIATFGERNSPIDMTVIETICETMLR